MAKKKKRATRDLKVSAPPEAFWLSQGGAVIPVQVHAEMLMLMPDTFGLDKAPYGKDEINAAMGRVISDGWIRARVLGNDTLQFQVRWADHITVRAIRRFLFERHFGIAKLVVETIEPLGYWSFALDEWFSQCYPGSWGLSAADEA